MDAMLHNIKSQLFLNQKFFVSTLSLGVKSLLFSFFMLQKSLMKLGAKYPLSTYLNISVWIK